MQSPPQRPRSPLKPATTCTPPMVHTGYQPSAKNLPIAMWPRATNPIPFFLPQLIHCFRCDSIGTVAPFPLGVKAKALPLSHQGPSPLCAPPPPVLSAPITWVLGFMTTPGRCLPCSLCSFPLLGKRITPPHPSSTHLAHPLPCSSLLLLSKASADHPTQDHS